MNNEGDDLEKLVVMAEKVTDTISDLNTRISNIRLTLMVSTAVLYASFGGMFYLQLQPDRLMELPFLIYTSISVLIIILILGSAYFVVQYFRKIRDYKLKLSSEKEILKELLDMVYEYKDHIYHGGSVSYVEEAILKLRLKRIEFAAKH